METSFDVWAKAHTGPASRARWQGFLDKADPTGTLSPTEREAKARTLLREEMRRVARVRWSRQTPDQPKVTQSRKPRPDDAALMKKGVTTRHEFSISFPA